MTQEIREIAFKANGTLDMVFDLTRFPDFRREAMPHQREYGGHGCSKDARLHVAGHKYPSIAER